MDVDDFDPEALLLDSDDDDGDFDDLAAMSAEVQQLQELLGKSHKVWGGGGTGEQGDGAPDRARARKGAWRWIDACPQRALKGGVLRSTPRESSFAQFAGVHIFSRDVRDARGERRRPSTTSPAPFHRGRC